MILIYSYSNYKLVLRTTYYYKNLLLTIEIYIVNNFIYG